MGTRGSLGVVIDGAEKLSYNHFDSYPSGLGDAVLKWLRTIDSPAGIEEIKTKARAMRLVDEEEKPTPEDIERFGRFSDTSVGGPMTNTVVQSWYQLMRQAQGDLGAMLDAGVMLENNTFPMNSLFCEWAYVVDLDAERLEVYEGFQKAPHTEGRFATEDYVADDGYYPCRLVASWPLSALPTDEAFIAATDPPEADEDDDEPVVVAVSQHVELDQ